MIYEKSCGAVVFTRDNGEVKFVLVKQKSGFYSFPKGHVEEGETEKQTAAREIFEETGLTPIFIDGLRAWDEHQIPGKKDAFKRVIYFLAEYKDQNIVYCKEELLGTELLPFSQALALFKHESSKRILKKAMNFISKYQK